MTDPLVSLTAKAEEIHAQYRRSFAGRSRATRDIGQLDALIAEMEKVRGAVPPAATALQDSVGSWLDLYKTERSAIADIQKGGADAITAWRLVEWAEVGFQRYMRLYAGQRRTTRDVWLLQELHDEQVARIKLLSPLAKKLKDEKLSTQLSNMEKNLALYAEEIKQIGASKGSLANGEHAKVLATLANTQFQHYRVHFADKVRSSRRPALLRRINKALADIRTGMEALRQLGVQTEAHVGNIRKVADRIGGNERELEQILAARRQASAQQLAGAMGDEANAIFREYRDNFSGKSRGAVDAVALAVICERLHEIVRNMSELQAERPTEANGKNIGIVIETLKAYEREHRAILEAQKQ